MKRTARFLFRAIFPKNKFFLLLALFLVGWVVITPILTQGQETLPNSNTYTQQYAPGVPRDENTALQVKLVNVLSALACQITGTNPAYPQRPCVGIDRTTGSISFLPKPTAETGGGAIGFASSMIAMTYDMPKASTIDYIAYLGDNFGIAKSAHAQGVGFSSLSPILPLWTASRNIAYLFYILAFIVIGVLIMIRVRIDPRTVMTIQNQIPKIVVGIILITFSYAIAGFLIDFMYVSIYTFTNIIMSADPELSGPNAPYNFAGRLINQSNPISAADLIGDPNDDFHLLLRGLAGISWTTADPVGEAVANMFRNDFGSILGLLVGGIFATFIGGQVSQGTGALGTIIGVSVPALLLAGTVLSGGTLPGIAAIMTALGAGATTGSLLGKAVGVVGGTAAAGAFLGGYGFDDAVGFLGRLLGFIVISIAILSSLFRLWFSMIKAYILILIIIIMSPFYILFGLIPGSSFSFSNWLRAMLANLSIFPVAIVMFLVARVIIDGMDRTQTSGLFVPPMVGNASIAGMIQSIVGLAFILLTPSIAEMVKGIFHSKSSPHNAAIPQGLAAGIGFTAGMVKNPFALMGEAGEYRLTEGAPEKIGILGAIRRKYVR